MAKKASAASSTRSRSPVASRSSSSPRIVAITSVAVRAAVGDEGIPIREIAEILASNLGVPALSVAPERAAEYVGFLGGFWGFDGPASAQTTRDLLGWEPTGPGLIADLKEGHYFA